MVTENRNAEHRGNVPNESILPPLEELSRREVYREQGGADFLVTEVRTRVRKTGESAQFNVVSIKNGTPGVACIVQSADGRFLIGHHWRVSTAQFAWEFPRGMGEVGESIAETAVRELEEETGFTVSDMAEPAQFLQIIHPDTGLLSSEIAVVLLTFRQTALEISALHDDQSNDASRHTDWELNGQIRWISPDELLAMIADGQMTDGITIAAYAVWQACASR